MALSQKREEPDNYKEDEFYEENYNDDEWGSMSENTLEPPSMDYDTFKQRNDPEPLIKKLRLQLMNAYEVKKEITNDDGSKRIELKIKQKKNSTPMCNKEGVERLVGYVQELINSHTVQGNKTTDQFNRIMADLSLDINTHVFSNRLAWGMRLGDASSIIDFTVGMLDFFLSRTINNKEREAYSLGFKEISNVEKKPEKKPNFLEKTYNMFSGKYRT